MDLIEIAQYILQLITDLIDIITGTAERIDSITFQEGNIILQYLGYAKYVMTTPLYTMFTTVILISVGVTVWTYLLKGLGYLKNVLPW